VTQFCSCAAAKTILDQKMGRLVQPLTVAFGAVPNPKTDFAYEDEQLQELLMASILLPETGSMQSSLSGFTFELFNCKEGRFRALDDKAKAGEVSADRYVLEKERIEVENGKNHDEILNKCKGAWNIGKEELARYLRSDPNSNDLELAAWWQDFMGHGDAHRATWIENFQKGYCKKHPEDVRSCKLKKKDLVDLHAMHRMPVSEQGKILARRICARYSEAPRKVQIDVADIARANCPKVMEKDL